MVFILRRPSQPVNPPRPVRPPSGAHSKNAAQLWRELQGIGFAGTSKQVHRWLSERRAGLAGTTIRSSPAPTDTRVLTSTASPLASSKQLSWYLLREPEDLGP